MAEINCNTFSDKTESMFYSIQSFKNHYQTKVVRRTRMPEKKEGSKFSLG